MRRCVVILCARLSPCGHHVSAQRSRDLARLLRVTSFARLFHGSTYLWFALPPQFDNLVRPLERGFGQTLDHKTFTVDDLIRAIKAALHEPKYRHNAQQIKQRLRAHTRLPVQRAADWIEYAVRTDGAPFLTPIAYTETDLVWQCAPALVVTGTTALVMGVICATTRRLCRLCRMSKPRAKRE
eukprot:2015448-Pleurochrysis_carterae.AAC.1